MVEHLSDPRAGDIWWQTVVILGNDPDNSEGVLVSVSDIHGMMTKKESMLRQLLQNQFHPDPNPEKKFKYFRKVRIEEVNEKMIFFVRLDKNDEEKGSTQCIKREIFLYTYFLPSHDTG